MPTQAARSGQRRTRPLCQKEWGRIEKKFRFQDCYNNKSDMRLDNDINAAGCGKRRNRVDVFYGCSAGQLLF